MVETLQYVNGLALVILGFFLKREIDKNDKNFTKYVEIDEKNKVRIEQLEKDVMLHKEKLTNHIEMITSALTKMELNVADLKKDVDHITLYVHEARHELKNVSHEKTLIASMLKEINDKIK